MSRGQLCWARTGGCPRQLILGACRGPLLDFPTLTLPGGREEPPCPTPRAQPEATEADWGFGAKVPTPPPSMTAAKRLAILLLLLIRPSQGPGGPAPATTRPAGLTRGRGGGGGGAPQHSAAAHPTEGTLHGGLPLPPSRDSGRGGQGVPSGPLRLPGTKLRRKRTLPPTACRPALA